MISLGIKENGLYILQIMDTHPEDSNSSHQTHNQLKLPTQANTCYVNASFPLPHVQNIVIPKSTLWHFRLGHAYSKRIAQMSKLYSSFDFDNNATYDICHLAKQRKLPSHSSNSIASHKFELLHFDIWGPLSTLFIHNHKYFLTILDDHTRFVWIVLLKSKVEVSMQVQNFISMIINQFQITPKTVKLDNGP